jgi:hypothetical protein
MDRNLTETPATFGVQFKDVEFQTSMSQYQRLVCASRDKRATIVYSHGLSDHAANFEAL